MVDRAVYERGEIVATDLTRSIREEGLSRFLLENNLDDTHEERDKVEDPFLSIIVPPEVTIIPEKVK